MRSWKVSSVEISSLYWAIFFSISVATPARSARSRSAKRSSLLQISAGFKRALSPRFPRSVSISIWRRTMRVHSAPVSAARSAGVFAVARRAPRAFRSYRRPATPMRRGRRSDGWPGSCWATTRWNPRNPPRDGA